MKSIVRTGAGSCPFRAAEARLRRPAPSLKQNGRVGLPQRLTWVPAAAGPEDASPAAPKEPKKKPTSPASQQPQQQPRQPAAGRSRARRDDDSFDEEALETVQYAFGAASDAAQDAADTTAAAAQQALETSQAALEQAAGTAQDAVQGAFSVAQDAAAAVSEVASQEASRLVDQAAAAAGWPSPSGSSSSSSSPAGQPAVGPDSRFAGWKVLVAGATGGVGRRVVEVLAAKGAPLVRALVRDTSKAVQLLPTSNPAVQVTRGDVYQYSSLPQAVEGCDAIICCTGASDPRDPFGPFNVDYQGTLNLIAAAKAKGVKKFVLVTSIGADDIANPLNLFWGVLFWKKRAEEALQRSGLSYTIVRPGGLKNSLRSGEREGNIVMKGPNYYGFPPLKQSGSILRSQVAEVCLEAMVQPAAADKVVEVVADTSAPALPWDALFANAQQY